MRRMTTLAQAVSLALAVAMAPGVAGAAHGPTAAPARDSVVGSGKFPLLGRLFGGRAQFELAAHSGPSGEAPRGHITFKVENFAEGHVDVTCLHVAGNRAFVFGRFREPVTRNGVVYTHGGVFLLDGGQPSDPAPANSAPDLADLVITGGAVDCASYIIQAGAPMEQGNVTVHDGTP